MALTLSSFVETSKMYSHDSQVSNEMFLNRVVAAYAEAAKITLPEGRELYLDKSRTSRIMNGVADVPRVLRRVGLQHGLEGRLTNECAVLYDEELDPSLATDLESSILQLVDGEDSRSKTLRAQLQAASADKKHALFLARALAAAMSACNKVDRKGLIWKCGTGSLYWRMGDLLNIGFDNRRTKKSLVVIPVDCEYRTHVTRRYEGALTNEVSENTIHGKWLGRMRQSGVSEQELARRIDSELERAYGHRVDGRAVPMGTIVPIETQRAAFLLLAMSRFDGEGVAHATADDVAAALQRLLAYYSERGQGADLYLPLLGSGLSKAGIGCVGSFSLIRNEVLEGPHFIGGKVEIVVTPDAAREIGLGS